VSAADGGSRSNRTRQRAQPTMDRQGLAVESRAFFASTAPAGARPSTTRKARFVGVIEPASPIYELPTAELESAAATRIRHDGLPESARAFRVAAADLLSASIGNPVPRGALRRLTRCMLGDALGLEARPSFGPAAPSAVVEAGRLPAVGRKQGVLGELRG
jgi:hypothetical protein